jgi:FlaA1/EpsC-like NDP-sugar epimerase
MTSHHVRRNRRFFIRAGNLLIFAASLTLAYLLRFDFALPPSEVPLLYWGIAFALAIKSSAFYFFGIDRGWSGYAGISDAQRILRANVFASAFFAIAVVFVVGSGFPRSVYCIDFLLCFLLTSGARFSKRIYSEAFSRKSSRRPPKGFLIYGAGPAGLTLAREIRATSDLNCNVLGFLDDDPNKEGAVLMGIRVLGTGRDAAAVVDRYKKRSRRVDEIIIAMPEATGVEMSEALANCRLAGVPCKTIPSVGELLTGKISVGQLREISEVDLLGRDPVLLEEDRIRADISGKPVMVTGAAGSIGSELCRQLARFEPSVLVAFDKAESDLYRIEIELKKAFPNVRVSPQIGDIRDLSRLEEAIQAEKVQAVFHAAAYKHVPLMENHLLEAVKNNVIGTYNVVKAAQRNQLTKFVMISSDKAVNPTNIMGLTKRVAELIVASMPSPGALHRTRFVSVRFGNVLGSNGSVVPLFKAQIAAGGPVTVTHPEMRRYFMTIPEAAQLVLQASTMGRGSEIFVLDMGEPVLIVDLARNMIRLAGREPDKDIPIRFTGLRPGEKLFEEIALKGDQMRPTYHEKILIFIGRSLSFDAAEAWVAELKRLIACHDERGTLIHMKNLVPEYEPTGKWNEALQNVLEHAASAGSGSLTN